MTPRVPNRIGLVLPPVAFSLLLLLLSVPAGDAAGEPFPGYPKRVQAQGRVVVDAAGPGSTDKLAVEVRSLRKLMYDAGIVSMNAVPVLIFERAAREGWKRKAAGALSEVARVAPLSVPLWGWMIREDISELGLNRFLADLSGLGKALWRYVPALVGCAALVLLFASAAACWFAGWASIALLLRARPALTADVSRVFKRFPRPEIPAAIVVLAMFAVPVFAGAGLGVCAVFWIALSAGYLRRGELVIATTAILLLSAVFLSGGFLNALDKVADDSRKGGWLAVEGYYPQSWPESTGSPGYPFSGPRWEALVKFSRARAEMQGEKPEAADRLWSELIRDGQEAAGAYNNRGFVRARMGRTEEAIADFEAAVKRSPAGGPAHWNAYQLYLQTFRLEEAGRIQSAAWSSLGSLSPFESRGEEMTHGEMVPSTLPVGDVWRHFVPLRGDWLRGAETSHFHALFFRPLPGRWVPAILAAGWLWAAVWKILSRKIWLHSSCRSCGTRTMVVGIRESADICNSCRAQVGGGVRGGDERARRVLNITLHRRYVRACSVLFPGSGALWAGKDLQAMFYGIALCLSLGALSVSLGSGPGSQGLISDLQALVMWGALACIALLWAGGAWWGWRSFELLQLRYNVAGERS